MRISNMLGATMIAGAPSPDSGEPDRAEALAPPEAPSKPMPRPTSIHRLRPGRTRGRLVRSSLGAPLPDQTI